MALITLCGIPAEISLQAPDDRIVLHPNVLAMMEERMGAYREYIKVRTEKSHADA